MFLSILNNFEPKVIPNASTAEDARAMAGLRSAIFADSSTNSSHFRVEEKTREIDHVKYATSKSSSFIV